MSRGSWSRRVCGSVVAAVAAVSLVVAGSPGGSEQASASTPSSSSRAKGPRRVSWMPGLRVAGTPARYNKVGVIKVGPAGAKNVLVLEPGTSAGSAYFVPLAKWLLSKTTGWQIWSVERRENLLEDQSQLDAFKHSTTTSTQVYDYYPASFAVRTSDGALVVIPAARALAGKVVPPGAAEPAARRPRSSLTPRRSRTQRTVCRPARQVLASAGVLVALAVNPTK